MTNHRARARWAWLAAALCVLAALLLVVDAGGLRTFLFPGTRTEPAPNDAALLDGAAPHDATGPMLEGARRSEKADVAANSAGHGPVTVTVADRTGHGIGGVRVQLHAAAGAETQGEPTASELLTDEDGRAVFAEDVPYDGSRGVTVTARGGLFFLEGQGIRLTSMRTSLDGVMTNAYYVAEEDDSAPNRGQALGGGLLIGPDLRFTIPRALPLEVDVRQAPEGRALRAHWQATPRLEWAEDTTDRATIPVDADGDAMVKVVVKAPRGTVAPRGSMWGIWVHPATRRLEAVVPVRAEAELTALFPAEVPPFHGEDWNLNVEVGGQPLSGATAHVGSEGRVRIHGVPHLAGEKVTLGGTIADRWVVFGETVLTDDPMAPLVVEMVAKPIALDAPTEFILGPGSFSLTLNTQGLRFEVANLRSALTAASSPEAPTGTLRVRVRLPSGAPAAGALVQTGSSHGEVVGTITDPQGWATLSGLRSGSYELHVNGAGATTTATANVEAGRTLEVEVPTTDGGTIEVAVVDARGRPLPFATLTITQPSGLPWLDLDGELQRIDPYTDEHGHRTLRRMEASHVLVQATFGSRSAEATVTVIEGRTAEVRLVLKPAEPAPPAVEEPAAAER